MQVQIYEKTSNYKRKRDKRFIFYGFQSHRNGILPTVALIVRRGRTTNTLLTSHECANDVLKLSPYSFGGLLVYL